MSRHENHCVAVPCADAVFPARKATSSHFGFERFQDSELGEIPEGWEVKRLGDLCARVAMGPFGSDIKTSSFVPDGVPVIRGGNLTDGFAGGKFVFLTEAKADELRHPNARSGIS